MDESEEYRIVQTSDHVFVVEKAHHYQKRGYWPWSPYIPCIKWVRSGLPGCPIPFKSQELAQKHIDDKRKYPIVVKHPA